MRVRLYEVGDGMVGLVLRCDQFPVTLAVQEPGGRLIPDNSAAHAVCRLDDAGGQILFEGLDTLAPILVNDAPLARGPLHPGDQLSLAGHRYVVSYEQMAATNPCEERYRLVQV